MFLFVEERGDPVLAERPLCELPAPVHIVRQDGDLAVPVSAVADEVTDLHRCGFDLRVRAHRLCEDDLRRRFFIRNGLPGEELPFEEGKRFRPRFCERRRDGFLRERNAERPRKRLLPLCEIARQAEEIAVRSLLRVERHREVDVLREQQKHPEQLLDHRGERVKIKDPKRSIGNKRCVLRLRDRKADGVLRVEVFSADRIFVCAVDDREIGQLLPERERVRFVPGRLEKRRRRRPVLFQLREHRVELRGEPRRPRHLAERLEAVLVLAQDPAEQHPPSVFGQGDARIAAGLLEDLMAEPRERHDLGVHEAGRAECFYCTLLGLVGELVGDDDGVEAAPEARKKERVRIRRLAAVVQVQHSVLLSFSIMTITGILLRRLRRRSRCKAADASS